MFPHYVHRTKPHIVYCGKGLWICSSQVRERVFSRTIKGHGKTPHLAYSNWLLKFKLSVGHPRQ